MSPRIPGAAEGAINLPRTRPLPTTLSCAAAHAPATEKMAASAGLDCHALDWADDDDTATVYGSEASFLSVVSTGAGWRKALEDNNAGDFSSLCATPEVSCGRLTAQRGVEIELPARLPAV